MLSFRKLYLLIKRLGFKAIFSEGLNWLLFSMLSKGNFHSTIFPWSDIQRFLPLASYSTPPWRLTSPGPLPTIAVLVMYSNEFLFNRCTPLDLAGVYSCITKKLSTIRRSAFPKTRSVFMSTIWSLTLMILSYFL